MIIKLNRKKVEKTLVFVLSIVMLLGILPIGASAEYNPNIEPPYEYEQPTDITGIDDESNTLFTTASSTTFNVANSAQLSNALASITDGSVINITESFIHRSPILIDGISVELNLGGNTLRIVYDPVPNPLFTAVLTIQNGATLTVTGPGTLDVIDNEPPAALRGGMSISVRGWPWRESALNNNAATINAITSAGLNALFVEYGTATVTNVSGIASVYMEGTVTVNGNVTGAVSAFGSETVVTVNGHVTNGTQNTWAGGIVRAQAGGAITVNGNITGNTVYGILASNDGTVTVNGDITAAAYPDLTSWDVSWGDIPSLTGIRAMQGGNVILNGNMRLIGPTSIGVSLYQNNNTVTVNGRITATRYIVAEPCPWSQTEWSITNLTADQYDSIVDIGGESYRKYNPFAGNVFVKIIKEMSLLPQGWDQPEAFNRFNDVPNGNWQNAAVSWADRNNITTGSPAGSSTFRPNGDVTRAEFVTFLHRIYGSPGATRATFRDMPGNPAFQNAISWALAEGITTGSPAGSRTFMPNANITREQIAAMLYRYVGGGMPAPIDSLTGYTDRNRISTWAGAREAVNWAVYNGIMGQNVTTLNPGGNATRAEAVTMLYRVVEIFSISAP